MRGPERVVDVDVGVRGEGRGEGRIVGLLLGVEAEVLEHEHLARSEALDRVLGADPERVAGDRHVPPHELGQDLADRPEAEPVLDLAVRPAEVAGEDHRRPGVEERDDGRDRGTDARVVGDPAVGQRDVEVDADEDPFAGDVRVADRELVHRGQAVTGRRAATNAMRSATRQL